MAKRRTTDIELYPQGDIELPKEQYAWTVDTPDLPDVVNWPSPQTRGPVGPPSRERQAAIATAITPQHLDAATRLSSSDAIGVLRRAFGAFDPRYSEAPSSDPSPAYGDPLGALRLNALREGRAGELADRLRGEEATLGMPMEGYVQGEPGRRRSSAFSGLMNARFLRGNLQELGGEMATDPYTGDAAQQVVRDRQNALEQAATAQRPEVAAGANALASRNAFANFLNKQAGYGAEISDAGTAALDAASRRKVAESEALGGMKGGLKQIPDPNHPGSMMWVRAQDAIGSTAAMPATERVRVNSAQTVLDTRDDILNQISDPNVASQLGPAMGRFNSVREFLGNPPPELAQLAGQIESFAFANLGVHGMRSARGAQELKQIFDQKHTPESLAAAISGVSQFSEHFIRNATGTAKPNATSGGAPSGTVQMRAPDGTVQPVPAAQVEHYQKLGATVVQ